MPISASVCLRCAFGLILIHRGDSDMHRNTSVQPLSAVKPPAYVPPHASESSPYTVSLRTRSAANRPGSSPPLSFMSDYCGSSCTSCSAFARPSPNLRRLPHFHGRPFEMISAPDMPICHEIHCLIHRPCLTLVVSPAKPFSLSRSFKQVPGYQFSFPS